jgi:signal transduction histidine kinase
MESGARSVSSPFVDSLTSKPAVAVALPVANEQGKLTFLLTGFIDLSRPEFAQPLFHAKNLGETFHAELVDQKGMIIASTEAGSFLQPGEHLEFYTRMLSTGAEGVETVPYESFHPHPYGEDDDDEQHVMAFVPFRTAPWGLALGGSKQETFGPVTSLRNNILRIGALSLVALWVVTLVGARLLVRPVRALTAAANRIASGNLESPIHVAEGGEIGELGESLEAMRSRLKDSLEELGRWGSELETKVGERTEELRARNRQLTALTAVATAANESRDLHQMLERCLDIVLEHSETEIGAIRLLERESGTLLATCTRGDARRFPCRERAILQDECPCGHIAATGELLVGRAGEFKDSGQHACLAQDVQFMAVLPLTSPKGVQGVLYLGSSDTRQPAEPEIEMLTAICNQIGVAIENAQLFQDLGKMEAQRELDRLKSQFVSAISHELRTPLGFIKGYVTTLLRDDVATEADTQGEFLRIISEESDKLQRLIDDLLDASRLQAGELELSRIGASIGTIAEEAVQKAKDAHPEHEFVLAIPSSVPEVFIDQWRVEQVLNNLLDNATKYSPPGSVVTIRARVQEPELVISVRDHGDGLRSEEVQRVFEPFYRGENATDRQAPGTGLGLTVCRGIVEAHGGRMWVESQPGTGSTFYFSLPLATDGLDAAVRDGRDKAEVTP